MVISTDLKILYSFLYRVYIPQMKENILALCFASLCLGGKPQQHRGKDHSELSYGPVAIQYKARIRHEKILLDT
jgi:hypothetical protein